MKEAAREEVMSSDAVVDLFLHEVHNNKLRKENVLCPSINGELLLSGIACCGRLCAFEFKIITTLCPGLNASIVYSTSYLAGLFDIFI